MPSETLTSGNVVYEKSVCLGNCSGYCYLMSQCPFLLSLLTEFREYSGKQPAFVGSYWMVFPGGSAGKESSCNAGDLGSILGLRRSPEEGKCYPLQYSGLENSMDSIVHGVTKSWTWLSDFHVKTSTHFQNASWEVESPILRPQLCFH